ncbi:MAG: ribose 5-phosphate isomerase A [Thermoplasmata archaeon M11B2D]|nr:MAG: ribose 5-phosphate isomerase A [Thermoplasmata archaeon M11B2D]PNX54131.1 MAG: ribose 5-phosphate isomerase A [Thermoplasmata archaeon M9B2D]
MEQQEMKKQAAEKAVQYIEDGMTIGLGTGSTVEYAIKKIGEMIKTGLHIEGVPTSLKTKRLAMELKIPLIEFDDRTEIDITIDGADEVDSNLNLIKGGGGALTREKIIAYHSKKVIIIVDETKIVKGLGCDCALPVEVTKFGWSATKKIIEGLGCTAELRKIMDEAFITDNQNYILDCEFGKIADPEALEKEINNIPGVLENGLFIGLADEVIVGSKQGMMTLERQDILQ